MLKLAIHDFEGRTHYVPLKDGEYSIGRDDANQICLSERNVSRQHARVLAKNSQVWIENIAATYGTRFNSLLLRDRTEVQVGDVIEVGDYKLELVSDDPSGGAKRDNAVRDPSQAEAAPAGGQASKGKAPDGATAIVNLADISSLLNKDASAPSQTIAEAAQPRLVVESENLKGLELRITKTPVVIGRVRENADLVIDHRSISKEHARLTRLNDGTWQVLDLGSANGIKVNGEPYSKSEVRSGDRLELGHVTLRFLAAGARASSGSVGPATGGKKPNGALVLGIGVAVLVVLGVVAALVLVNKSPVGEPAKAGKGTEERGGDKTAGSKPDESAKAGGEPAKEAGKDDAAKDQAAKDQAAKAEPKADKDHAAEPEAAKAAPENPPAALAPADQLMAAVNAKIDDNKYEEALMLLEAAKIQNPHSAPIAAKYLEIKKIVDLRKKLVQAQHVMDSGDPAKALDTAMEVLSAAPEGSPLKLQASSVVDMAKKRLKDKTTKAAQGKEPHGDGTAKPPKEDKAPPKEEPKAAESGKSAKDYYDDAREALGAGEWERAISAGKQSLKAGYKKANTVLAKAYYGKGDKANCLKHAKAAIDAGFEDSQTQSLVDKCGE